jgi:hypothetical protein
VVSLMALGTCGSILSNEASFHSITYSSFELARQFKVLWSNDIAYFIPPMPSARNLLLQLQLLSESTLVGIYLDLYGVPNQHKPALGHGAHTLLRSQTPLEK